LVPANRFEVLECRVAIDAVNEGRGRTPRRLRTGALDVLAQPRARACRLRRAIHFPISSIVRC